MRKNLPILASIATFRGPFQARIAHTAGVSAASVAAAASAASAAQSTADSAASSASLASSNTYTAISALLAGPGVPMKCGPTLVGATGSAVLVNCVYPGFWPTYATGQRLGVKGVVTARKTDGTILQSKDVDAIFIVDATDPDAITYTAEKNSHSLNQANHADFATYFASNDLVADFDSAGVTGAGQGAFRLVTTPTTETTSDFRLEADFIVRDLGSPVPA